MRTKITTPEILLDTQEFSTIRLPTQGVRYPKRSLRQSMAVHYTIYAHMQIMLWNRHLGAYHQPKEVDLLLVEEMEVRNFLT